MKKTLIIIVLTAATLLVCLHKAKAAGAGDAAHTIPTNVWVNATNAVLFTCPYAYNWITFSDDSSTNIYMCANTNFTTIYTTNFYFATGQSNRTDYVTNTLAIAPTIGTGIRLNANGGTVFFDANGKPTSRHFQFIAAGGVSNNVSILIGSPQ
jgi:hypothetical protein